MLLKLKKKLRKAILDLATNETINVVHKREWEECASDDVNS